MKTFKKTFESIEELFGNAKFSEALGILRKIDVSSLTETEYSYYCLLLSQAILSVGDNKVDEYIQKALSFYKLSNDDILYARSRYLFGWHLAVTGDFIEAHEVLMESFVFFKRHDRFREMSLVLNRLAYVQNHTGAIEDAISNLRESIAINKNLGVHANVIQFSRNLGMVLVRSGKFHDAITHFQSLTKEVKNLDVGGKLRFDLGYSLVLAFLGQIDEAIKKMQAARPKISSLMVDEAIFYEYLGWIYNLDSKYNRAVETLEKGVKIAIKIGPESTYVSQTKRLLADAYLGLKKYDLAHKTAQEALEVAEKIRERSEIAACYRIFAQVEQNKNNSRQAKVWYGKAIDIFSNVKSRYELAVTRYQAAISGLYENGEKAAMLYLAKEYFVSENIEHYVSLTERELDQYRQMIPAASHPGEETSVFIVRDKRMKQLVKLAENVAPSAMTIFLTGPTGSGKDQLARYIHHYSGRKGKFVIVNSAAIPDSMVEAELFGFKRGAFTGAEHSRVGLLEEADGGTFYLNEIADATPEFQAKLLEVIETKFIRQLGSNARKSIDIRIIAATNNDLEEKMKSGRFRRDLYHRLNEIPIELMPLSDRPDDIRALIEHFIERNGHDLESVSDRKNLESISKILAERSWPGHVRELKAEVNRLYLLARGDLGRMAENALAENHDECEQLLKALEQTGWNRRETARLLGISEGAVRYRIKKYEIAQDVTA
ncbi:MAG: hypothetical protein CVT49_07575 [candidate division Zixibacteria bacterium HGW-Zixibacteria-1]|nr:MAG: hypothetical protein CVT49_07575 [candidate division Zixibacteria bacterium HGW-Zixibacteria-1]